MINYLNFYKKKLKKIRLRLESHFLEYQIPPKSTLNIHITVTA